jgi:hypothetical protein
MDGGGRVSNDITQQDHRDPLGRRRLSPLQLPAGVMRRELVGSTHPQAKVFLNAVERLPDNRLVVVDRNKYEAAKNGTDHEAVNGFEGPDLGRGLEPGSGGED